MNNRIDLAEYFAEVGFKKGAEIGVADGRYSEVLCRVIPNLELLCVDPWNTYHGNHRGGAQKQQLKNYNIAQTRLSQFNATLIRKSSEEASKDVQNESLDFVFIDGNHDYRYVYQDLVLWSDKVRKGGIVSGHDYYHFKNSGVIEAVDTFCKAHGIKPNIIGEVRKHINDNYQTCYWWFKT